MVRGYPTRLFAGMLFACLVVVTSYPISLRADDAKRTGRVDDAKRIATVSDASGVRTEVSDLYVSSRAPAGSMGQVTAFL